jgi:hypothetical protein
MPDTPTTDAEEQSQNPAETWAYEAWRLWCAGNRNKSAIHRALRAKYGEAIPSDGNCITRAIARESKIARAALDIDETDALTEYIGGLEEQFGEADKILRNARNENARCGALKLKVDLLAKLAAAKGVVTERKAQEHSGSVAVAVTTIDVAAVVSDADKSAAACDLLALLRSGADDTGGPSGGDEPLPVATGAAPGPAEPQAHGPDGGPDAPPHGDDAASPREE